MTRMYLPQCEVCKHYETCVQKNIDKRSLFCMLNFYTPGFVWHYYEKHINDYAMTIEQLMEE